MSKVMVRAALYARVSSEQQAKQATVASQVAALRERIAADGLALADEHCFVDEGYSGSTLVRPALERLRDVSYAGGIDRLYIHAPDRLARQYAYQFLLLEEWERAAVEVVFLNQPPGETAEERLLVQMQGMIAEYERAKILERSRRGKRHAAQQGRVSALGRAPYGYRYLSKRSHGEARYELDAEQAAVVRQIFHWLGQERITLREVKRRLEQAGVPSPSGQTTWSASTLTVLVRNHAYRGQALFGGSRTPLRPSGTSNAKANAKVALPTIAIAVPVLIGADLFAAVQEQIEVNRKRYRQRRQGDVHLLQGLVVCHSCGRAYCYTGVRSQRYPQVYCYYRCTSMIAEGRQRKCVNPAIPAKALEEAVWQDVSALLREPRRLAVEYQRRLSQTPQQMESLTWLEQQQAKEKRALARLIDAYESGLLEKEEFATRVQRTRQRLQDWQTQAEALRQTHAEKEVLQQAFGSLEDFARRIETGLGQPTFAQQRQILKALVKRVEIAPDKIRVIYKIYPLPNAAPFKMGSLQDCSGRAPLPACKHFSPANRQSM